jgi:tRNA dimethylallyltransferase
MPRDEKYDHLSNIQLFDLLKEKDAMLANKITVGNKKRLVRALQILDQNKNLTNRIPPKFEALIILCDLPREDLYQKINMRVEEMMSHG